MFPQTDSLREFCFSGSNFYAELRIFALSMHMTAHMHRLQHKLERSIAANGKKSNAGKKAKNSSEASASRDTQADNTRPDESQYVSVKYLDQQTKAIQILQFHLIL